MKEKVILILYYAVLYYYKLYFYQVLCVTNQGLLCE